MDHNYVGRGDLLRCYLWVDGQATYNGRPQTFYVNKN